MAKITNPDRRKQGGIQYLIDSYGSLLAGVAVLLFFAYLLSIPKSEMRGLQESLAVSPTDTSLNLRLAEELLERNQYQEAEKVLAWAERLVEKNDAAGAADKARLEELWKQKHLEDPQEIQKLIEGWQAIVGEKPYYRDGYLQLAYLYFMLGDKNRSLEYVRETLDIDPNFEPALEMEKRLGAYLPSAGWAAS